MVRNSRAFWLFKQRNFDDAVAEYTKVLEQDPDYFNALTGRAEVYSAMGGPTPGSADPSFQDLTLADARRAVEIQPDDAQAHYLVGVGLSGRDIEGAIAAYTRAIELYPNYALAFAFRAYQLALMNSFDASIADAQRAVDLDPEETMWKQALVDVLLLAGRPSDAASITDEQLAANPEDLAWITRHAEALAATGNVAPAIAHLERALITRPGEASLHKALGDRYCESGRSADGIAAYGRAIEIRPSNPSFRLNRSLCRWNASDVSGAAEDARALIAIAPRDPNWHWYLGTLLASAGDYLGAIAAQTNAIELDPGNVSWLLYRAQAHLGAAEVEQSVADARHAVEIDSYAEAHMQLGISLFQSFDLPGADMALTEAIRLQPASAQAHLNRGIVRRRGAGRLRSIRRTGTRRSADASRRARAELLTQDSAWGSTCTSFSSRLARRSQRCSRQGSQRTRHRRLPGRPNSECPRLSRRTRFPRGLPGLSVSPNAGPAVRSSMKRSSSDEHPGQPHLYQFRRGSFGFQVEARFSRQTDQFDLVRLIYWDDPYAQLSTTEGMTLGTPETEDRTAMGDPDMSPLSDGSWLVHPWGGAQDPSRPGRRNRALSAGGVKSEDTGPLWRATARPTGDRTTKHIGHLRPRSNAPDEMPRP